MIIPTAQTIWLFDYDLTLYGFEEHGVLDSLDRNITQFVATHLGLEGERANRIRRDYCQEYGTTLGGLQARHGVAPHDYFDFIHGSGVQLPAHDPRKKALLQALPGMRFVFTNARRDWAERGLASMGIADCFAGLFDLEFCDWLGKPARLPYQKVEEGLRALGHTWDRPGRLVLLDDKTENLNTARELGWSTVWVHPEAKSIPSSYDWSISHLLDLAQVVAG